MAHPSKLIAVKRQRRVLKHCENKTSLQFIKLFLGFVIAL